MFIQVEETPNPNSMKFILGYEVTSPAETFEFMKDGDVSNPFIKSLFDVSGIEKVFASQNFLTITKANSSEWESLKVHIISAIMEKSGTERISLKSEEVTQEFEGIAKEIHELIEERVRPSVAMDGGDIQFIRFDEESGIAYVRMHGACSGCPSSSSTLNNGIKNMLQYYVPEVVDVVAV